MSEDIHKLKQLVDNGPSQQKSGCAGWLNFYIITDIFSMTTVILVSENQSVTNIDVVNLFVSMKNYLLEWKSLFGTTALIKMFVVCIYFTFRLWNVNITYVCIWIVKESQLDHYWSASDLQLNLSFKVINSTFLVQIGIFGIYLVLTSR